jgi:hypothetical protein
LDAVFKAFMETNKFRGGHLDWQGLEEQATRSRAGRIYVFFEFECQKWRASVELIDGDERDVIAIRLPSDGYGFPPLTGRPLGQRQHNASGWIVPDNFQSELPFITGFFHPCALPFVAYNHLHCRLDVCLRAPRAPQFYRVRDVVIFWKEGYPEPL